MDFTKMIDDAATTTVAAADPNVSLLTDGSILRPDGFCVSLEQARKGYRVYGVEGAFAQWTGLRWITGQLGRMALFHFGLVSPTRGVPYSISDVLSKFTARRNFETLGLQVKSLGDGPCGDEDLTVRFSGQTVCSSWTDSVDGRLDCTIPAHITGGGNLTFGTWETNYYHDREDRHFTVLPVMHCTLTASLGDPATDETVEWPWPIYDIESYGGAAGFIDPRHDFCSEYEAEIQDAHRNVFHVLTGAEYEIERDIIALIREALVRSAFQACTVKA